MEDLIDLSTVEVIDPDEVPPNIDAHGYLQGVYRGQIKPNGNRLRAAIAALPFERPKLGSVIVTNGNDLAGRLMYALQATNKVIDSRPTQVIEAPKAASAPTEPEPPNHSMVFPPVSRGGFRKRRF